MWLAVASKELSKNCCIAYLSAAACSAELAWAVARSSSAELLLASSVHFFFC